MVKHGLACLYVRIFCQHFIPQIAGCCWSDNLHTSSLSCSKTVISITSRVTHTHTHQFNGSLSWTTQVSRYQKCKTNLDFTEARDSKWQWHQLGHMQVCTLLQTDNHASTPPLCFLQAGCPSCHPTNRVKALKAEGKYYQNCSVLCCV